MHRRSALRQLAVAGSLGLAGCALVPDELTTDGTPAPTTTPLPDGFQRRVSIVDTDPVPEPYRTRIDATLERRTVTDDHTARLRISVTNEGPEREFVAGGDHYCGLFYKDHQLSEPRGLWLGAVGSPGPISQAGPRWVASPPDNERFGDQGCPSEPLATGKTVMETYDLYDDDRIGDYLDQGTYWFESSHLVPASNDEEIEHGPPVYAFAVSVENPT